MTIGLDIAKSVLQVHGVDAAGQVVVRRQLKRCYVLAFFENCRLPGRHRGLCLSHHWLRELQALGHTVRLMPPAYVKPYVKRQKNDMADAEAICEAVTRANMRFVPTKTPEQQSAAVLHRMRHLLIRRQTSVINAIRAHLAEFDVTAPVGRKGLEARQIFCLMVAPISGARPIFTDRAGKRRCRQAERAEAEHNDQDAANPWRLQPRPLRMVGMLLLTPAPLPPLGAFCVSLTITP